MIFFITSRPDDAILLFLPVFDRSLLSKNVRLITVREAQWSSG